MISKTIPQSGLAAPGLPAILPNPYWLPLASEPKECP